MDIMRVEKDKKRVSKMQYQQRTDRNSLIEAYQSEYGVTRQEWKDRVNNFEGEISSILASLKQKHKQELIEFTRSFHDEIRTRSPKFSKELLNMRKVQETLAKQKEFSEALKVRRNADKLQSEELIRLTKEHGERFEKRKAVVLLKQKQEIEAIELRAERDFREIQHQRRKELNK
jgi:hypothetical protein